MGSRLRSWLHRILDERAEMNERDYPIPSYAVYMWMVGDKLHVCFPPSIGTRSHTAIFPGTAKGLELAIQMLRERKRGQLTIGHKGEPTNYQVERTLAGDRKYNDWLRKREKAKVQQKELEELLKEVGYELKL